MIWTQPSSGCSTSFWLDRGGLAQENRPGGAFCDSDRLAGKRAPELAFHARFGALVCHPGSEP
jgi:hypothetical protein